jgi:hypothetical protein
MEEKRNWRERLGIQSMSPDQHSAGAKRLAQAIGIVPPDKPVVFSDTAPEADWVKAHTKKKPRRLRVMSLPDVFTRIDRDFVSVRKTAKVLKVSNATMARLQRHMLPDHGTLRALMKWLKLDGITVPLKLKAPKIQKLVASKRKKPVKAKKAKTPKKTRA